MGQKGSQVPDSAELQGGEPRMPQDLWEIDDGLTPNPSNGAILSGLCQEHIHNHLDARNFFSRNRNR